MYQVLAKRWVGVGERRILLPREPKALAVRASADSYRGGRTWIAAGRMHQRDLTKEGVCAERSDGLKLIIEFCPPVDVAVLIDWRHINVELADLDKAHTARVLSLRDDVDAAREHHPLECERERAGQAWLGSAEHLQPLQDYATRRIADGEEIEYLLAQLDRQCSVAHVLVCIVEQSAVFPRREIVV
eukprot:4420770-Prymnesium_polylepis.2